MKIKQIRIFPIIVVGEGPVPALDGQPQGASPMIQQ